MLLHQITCKTAANFGVHPAAPDCFFHKHMLDCSGLPVRLSAVLKVLLCMQIPFMKHGKYTIADSAFMIPYLQNTYTPTQQNAGMILKPGNEQQAALIQACTALVESNLHSALVYYRWVHNEVCWLLYGLAHTSCSLNFPEIVCLILGHRQSMQACIAASFSHDHRVESHSCRRNQLHPALSASAA